MGPRAWLYRQLDRGPAPEVDPESLLEIGRVPTLQTPMALAHLEHHGYAATSWPYIPGGPKSQPMVPYDVISIQARWAPQAAIMLDEFVRGSLG